jgi:hypothetical protein
MASYDRLGRISLVYLAARFYTSKAGFSFSLHVLLFHYSALSLLEFLQSRKRIIASNGDLQHLRWLVEQLAGAEPLPGCKGIP